MFYRSKDDDIMLSNEDLEESFFSDRLRNRLRLSRSAGLSR
jgi:hypothetical protein